MLIRRIEGERDDAKLELRQVKAECQSLRDRLKGLQGGHHNDLATMEDRIAELRLQLDEVSQSWKGVKNILPEGRLKFFFNSIPMSSMSFNITVIANILCLKYFMR